MLREPIHLLSLELLEDVGLNTVKVGLVFRLQVDDEVDVVPQIVIVIGMIIIAFFSVTVQLN